MSSTGDDDATVLVQRFADGLERLGREHAGDLAGGAVLDAALVECAAVLLADGLGDLGGSAVVAVARELDDVIDHRVTFGDARARYAGQGQAGEGSCGESTHVERL